MCVNPYIKCCLLIYLSLIISGCVNPKFQPVSDLKVEPAFNDSRFIMDDGYALPFKLFPAIASPKALVIALHGFNDYSQAFDSFCAYLAASDIQCLAYDQRGFGLTEYIGLWPESGRLQADLKKVVHLAKLKHPELPIYIAGESMGGAVILSALSDDKSYWQRYIAGTILFAPAVWARETQPWYQRLALWLAVHTVPGWKPTGESLDILATDNIEALREMGRDPLVIKETRIDTIFGLTNLMDQALNAADKQEMDMLVLYGAKDEVIPKMPTCLMLERLKASKSLVKVKLYPNGYHMLTRDLQADTVFKDVLSWVSQRGIAASSEEEQAAFCES